MTRYRVERARVTGGFILGAYVWVVYRGPYFETFPSWREAYDFAYRSARKESGRE